MSPFGPASSTIVALASGQGRAGVAVIRLSGKEAARAIEQICQPSALPPPRSAVLRQFVDSRTGEVIDKGLLVWFPAPHSFTGEDVAEFHVHGGPSIIKEMLASLCAIDGIEPAEPGAFSRRAFENGKLDLTEAEGIADLVDAETAVQRRQALRQMDGAIGKLYREWSDRLTHLLALIEAEIDFADEELPSDISAGRSEAIQNLGQEIEAHLNDGHRGEKIRDGFMIALLGAPNAGKSTLLNALAQREAAIVAPTPGTTRDVIEVQLDLGGYPVTLVDTAGLREASDAIESEGIRRARARAEQADLKILLFDGAKGKPVDRETIALRDEDSLLAVNKADALTPASELEIKADPCFQDALFFSARTGEGMGVLSQRLIGELERRFVAGSTPALTRLRHRKGLEEALGHLRRAHGATQIELCAEDLRLAVRSLGRITGHVDVEDLLDVIFSSFCIGK